MSWSWELLVAHREEGSPCTRDVWGGMLAHGGRLFLFGGATVRYGPARAPGDLSTLGTLNDLWTYDPGTHRWELLESHDGSKDYTPSAVRPGYGGVGGLRLPLRGTGLGQRAEGRGAPRCVQRSVAG